MKVVRQRFFNLLAVSPALLVVAAALAWAGSSWHAHQQGSAFDAIPEGAARSSVVKSLGQPSKVRACGANLWWGDDAHYRGKSDGRCVTEERYEYFLVSLGMGYSADGTVVSKYRYVSE
jgi:hypothetical protein